MRPELPALRLDDYGPTELEIDCARCRRHAMVSTAMLRRKFGNVRLSEIARRVAASGSPRCELALTGDGTGCAARPIEPPFHLWAMLRDAQRDGWGARLICERHLEALKRARPCPQVVDLDLDTLVASHGYDMPLERLPRRLRCPECGTRSIRVEWIAPATRPAPPVAAPAGQLRILRR